MLAAVRDAGEPISRAEVAEIPFTAFTSQKKAHHIPGRLVVRRIPDLNPGSTDGQATLFDTWRFHAFFTTSDQDTVTADKTSARIITPDMAAGAASGPFPCFF